MRRLIDAAEELSIGALTFVGRGEAASDEDVAARILRLDRVVERALDFRMRFLLLCSALALAACDGAPPAPPLASYACGTDDLRCRSDEGCVRHYSLSMAEPDRFTCEPANGCATPLIDYCEGDGRGATCTFAGATIEDGGTTSAPFAACSYP